MEPMETEQSICSVFALPKKCYPRFNKFQKEALSVGQRFQVTLEKFHKLTETEETEDLQQINKIIKNLADAEAVLVAIFGKFHDEISSHNLVTTTKESKYLTSVQSRLTRIEWMTKSLQYSVEDGKPVVYVYLIHIDKNDNLQELTLNIQQDKELFDLPSIKNLLFLVGVDPSVERKDSSIEVFEKFLRNIFHDTVDVQVILVSSSFEDLLSSEGKLPVMIQQHLERQVTWPLLKMRELIEANIRTYRKTSEEALQGPDAVYEVLKEKLLETFINNQSCFLPMLLDNLSFVEGMLDIENMVQSILEVFAQVLECLMVEVLANIYGIKDYRVYQMLKNIVFKKECSIIEHCIRDSLKSLPSGIFNFQCKTLQEDRARKKVFKLFSKAYQKLLLNELEKNADTDLKKHVNRIHEELEKKVFTTEKNLAIQHKLRFETESILKQTIPAYCDSHLLLSRNVSEALRDELQSIQHVAGVAVTFGQLQIHMIDCPLNQKKVVTQKIKETIARHKYWHSYKIGIITERPKYYHSVGNGLFSPIYERNEPESKRNGTLGGFMTDYDNNLYCLTCAHVIPEGKLDVFVTNRHVNGHIMIGQSIGVEIPPQGPCLSVDAADIVAVKVNPDQIPQCNPFFKTDNNDYGPCQILQPFDCSFGEHHRVYKWGATTVLTYGYLHMGYYNGSLFEDGVLNKYTYILVEPLPVDDVDGQILPVDASARYFAMPGDSGAIICAEGEDGFVQTIGMVQGGEMTIGDTVSSTNYCAGFYLWCALDKLRMRSNLDLYPVRFEEGKLRQYLQNQNHIQNNYEGPVL